MIDNLKPAYKTNLGAMFHGDSLSLLDNIQSSSINLVLTSPPFALLRPKEYGNLDQENYIDWFCSFAKKIKEKLTEDGSFVIDLGGAYQRGVPVRSLYNFKLLIKLVEELGFFLAEDFYWYNPSKLPSPIEWVNKRKIRAKDSVNTIWWLSKTEWPKANVSNVLVPYSERMKKLLKNPDKYYSPKERPSGHSISSSFSKNNGGAIPSNLLQIPNSESNNLYLRGCKSLKLKPHPARFPAKLPEFFINMLTSPKDTVLDIFAGSNTTGMVSESLDRNWISFEKELEYIAPSAFRFLDEELDSDIFQNVFTRIKNGESIDLSLKRMRKQLHLSL